MFKLHFDDYIKNVKYLSCFDNYELEQLVARINDKTEIDEIWNITRSFVVKYDPSVNCVIDNWKSDVIMSIFASIRNDLAKSYSKKNLARIIAKIECHSNEVVNRQAEIVRNNFLVTLREIRHTILESGSTEIYPFNNLPNLRIQYILGSLLTEDKSGLLSIEQGMPLKAIYPEDSYYYIKNYKQLPFWLSNTNGMDLAKWYKVISIIEKLKEIHSSNAVERELSSFIFDQLFSVTDLSFLLSYYWQVYEKFFYEIDNPERERSIILSTVFASLGKYVPLEVSYSPSEIFDLVKWYRNYESGKKVEHSELHQKLFQIMWYPYYDFPLCQTIFAYLLNKRFGKSSTDLQSMAKALQEYIDQHIGEFSYTVQVERGMKRFGSLKYPFKGNPVVKNSKGREAEKTAIALTEKTSHNSAADSFGINFTYNFFQSMYNMDYFTYAHIASWKKRFKIKDPRSFIIDKVASVDGRVRSVRNIYTVNFIQIKNPDIAVITIPFG